MDVSRPPPVFTESYRMPIAQTNPTPNPPSPPTTTLDTMEIYENLGSKEHPQYGKAAGLITAEDVASRLHDEIKGKTVLITGCGLASLGQHLAWTVARHEPKRLIVCGRSDVKLRMLANNLRYRNPGLDVRHETFDLADLSQVRKAAERINAAETVDVIICNAGIMMHPLRKTADGIEVPSWSQLDQPLRAGEPAAAEDDRQRRRESDHHQLRRLLVPGSTI